MIISSICILRRPLSYIYEIPVFLQYPLLKKATTSTGPPAVPGYVFEELIQLSFSSLAAAAQLAEYLTSRLARPSTAKAKVRIKSLCLHTLFASKYDFK